VEKIGGKRPEGRKEGPKGTEVDGRGSMSSSDIVVLCSGPLPDGAG
jgi:hypothetical protein